jgi:uncharacterized repeat protein (TIGR03803 family)
VNGTLYGTTYFGGSACDCHGTVFSLTTSGTEQVLHRFGDRPDGSNPAGLLDVGGTLYGVTYYGGRQGHGAELGDGTVFTISTTGTEHVLHSFRRPKGRRPGASLIDADGTLYGTTSHGGPNDEGTVFSMSTAGKEQLLYSFRGGSSDGEHPQASVIDVNDTLYGTTAGGGPAWGGTVFSISTSGKEQVLHQFGESSDGSQPDASLTNVNGTLYGTTVYGGKYGYGTVFSIGTSGREHVLYNFAGGSDGAEPVAELIDVKGTLYGTTSGLPSGCGTVFSISTAGKEHVLYNFTCGSDGVNPFAGLINVNGTFYGTTIGGGYGAGTVFALTKRSFARSTAAPPPRSRGRITPGT